MYLLKHNQKQIIIFTIIVVACIIVGSIFACLQCFNEEEKREEEPITFELDDRISPLENQGLILEIKRIRHRGLIDKIMKMGLSWRTKPEFYFISNMDGLEYVSKDVGSRRGVTEVLFNTWDTMFKENKIVRNAEEEQQTSDITITIMEREKTGILKLRSKDTEKLKISLTYDYKTGRWNGDDYFNDSDGYGHYVGKSFEIWFNLYQTDFDHDGIPYWTEVNVLHTDPRIDDSELDPDNDGIPTVWEWKWNYDPFVYDNHSILDPDIDGLNNIEEYKMAKWFADPYSQDIYLEIDGMQRGGIFDPPHVLWAESKHIIVERFAEHGINVYIDDGWPEGPINGGGELLTHYDSLSQDSGMMVQFYKNHFSDDRKGIFRYIVMCHKGGFCHPSEFNKYDTMAVGISYLQMIKGKGAFTPRAFRLLGASSVMHELGHSLGIGPWNVGGNDNISFNEGKQQKDEYLEKWGNYRSVMNYYHIYDKKLVDYSDGTNGPGDLNDWELFDLTYFQSESGVIEDPGFELPGKEEN